MFSNRGGSLVHDAVLRRPSALEREIEARKVELDPDDLGVEDAKRLVQELLTRLIAFENDDGLHDVILLAADLAIAHGALTCTLRGAFLGCRTFLQSTEGEIRGAKDDTRL